MPPGRRQRYLALVATFLPLVVFYVVEDQLGTTAGIIAAILFAFGEMGWAFKQGRRPDKLMLLSAGLVVGLGGLSLLSDDERFVLYTPVLSDLIFAGVLVFGLFRGEPILVTLARRQDPETVDDPVRVRYLRGMTARLAVNLVLHAGATTWAALFSTRAVWLVVSGPLQYAFFGVQVVFEMLWARFVISPRLD